MSNYRELKPFEIDILEKQGCCCAAWERVTVKDGFDPAYIRYVEFIGAVNMASEFEQPIKISFAAIKDSVIECNVIIRNIGRMIDNCFIQKGATIENVAHISSDGQSLHGVGHEVSTIVESGGREVTLHPELSAQTAYLQAFVTSEKFKNSFRHIMQREVSSKNSKICSVGRDALIQDCGEILNSNIGEGARISGVVEIKNSTINGSAGAGSVIRNSIVAYNGSVGAGCIIESCFVADAAVVDAGFTAENSLFFANSDLLRGEACAVFAGPYTSSHHKSTLILAGIYSFYTAGSGSNFSNHRFKLGPFHQGVVERGSKSGSSSYVIWPSRVAPFTSIIGKHIKVVDTSLFPFSLLVREGDKSILLPGALLFSSGYERDTNKWVDRDKRSVRSPDIINVQPLTPYTVSLMLKAIDTLKLMLDGYRPKELIGVEVPIEFIYKSLARYHAGVNFYYGNVVAYAMENNYEKMERLTSYCNNKECGGMWLDVAGLIVPAGFINELISDIEDGRISDYAEIQEIFQRLGNNYKKYEWEWVLEKIGDIYFAEDKSKALLENILVNWRKAAELRLELVKRDACKEFVSNMKIGYGLLEDVDEDFFNVRGNFEDNIFIKNVETQTADIIRRSDTLLAKIVL